MMRKLLPLAPLVLLGACTVGPDFAAPAPPPPEAGYASNGGSRAELAQGPELHWWKGFNSAELNALVDRALTHNHSLAASKATLEEAREQLAAVAGRRLPQVDANARAEYEQVNLSAIGLGDRLASAGLGNPEFDLYTVGGGVS